MDWPRLIDTPRLQLRDIRAGDAQDVFDSYAHDPQVLRFLGWPPHQSVEATRQHISHDIHRWMKGSARVWGLTLVEAGTGSGKVFGQIELVPMSFPADETSHLRLGYLMARSHWGHGLMQEAVMAVLQVAFARHHVWRVDALCDVDNLASSALLARVGMAREGLLRHAVTHPNVAPAPRDAWLHAMVRGDSLMPQAVPARSANLACAAQSR